MTASLQFLSESLRIYHLLFHAIQSSYWPHSNIIHMHIKDVTSRKVPDFITMHLSQYTTFLSTTTCTESRGSSVGTATRLRAGRPTIRGSILGRGKIFSSFNSVQTDSPTQWTLGGSSPEVKVGWGVKLTTHRGEKQYLQSPIHFHSVVLN
jgi:hypothetical protein